MGVDPQPQDGAVLLPGAAADGADDSTAARHAAALRRRRWRRIRWTARGLVVLLAAGFLRFVGLDCKFYYPDNVAYDQPAMFGLKCEDVTFRTRDGLTLHGWFLPSEGEPKGTVIHFHGNAANVSAHVVLVKWLPAAGYNVLMFDYRGYGTSQGRVTRAGTILDGHAALDYALSRPDSHDLPAFFYGQSLGGAVAIVVAAERPEVRAVVAESTFGSYRGIAAAHVYRIVKLDPLARLLARISISGGYDPLDVVGRLSPRPLLVIAAGADEICFPDLARQLYDAAGGPKDYWLVPRAEHLGVMLEAEQELIDRVTRFLVQAVEPPTDALR